VVFVGPGLGRVEEEVLGQGEIAAQRLEIGRRRLFVGLEDGAARDHRDLLRREPVVLDQVVSAPRGHQDHGRGALAVEAVDRLAPAALPVAEQLGEVDVLEVVRLVDARHPGGERILEREVDHVGAVLLDRAVGRADGETDSDPRQPLEHPPDQGAETAVRP
jgi:hypothetical protein